MSIWSAEIKELEKLIETFKGQFPDLEKELAQLIKTQDPVVLMLYARRSLELIITDLCERELKRPRKTQPLKGIIDLLHSENKVPEHIIASMHGLNSLSTYGTHPKDFDPDQVKPVINNLIIVIRWYIKYRESIGSERLVDDRDKGLINVVTRTKKEIQISKKTLTSILALLFLIVFISTGIIIFYSGNKQVLKDAPIEKSIAVLPFRNDSPDDSTTYFLNGVMEEMLTKLQAIKDLKVISRTSVEQYRDKGKSISEIAKELGVNYIVEGSGQKSGNLFRLRVQLIKAVDDSHLWAKTFEQKNITAVIYFNIQTQVAEEIAGQLNSVISLQEKQIIEKIPTENLEAYENYLLGQFHWRKLTKEDMDIAMQYFERAKEIDPDYALAYAGICNVWIGRQQMGFSAPEVAFPKAIEAVTKAMELDSNRAEVHYTLALISTWGMWDWKEGEAEFLKTLAINPNHAEARAYYSHFLNMMGRPKEALQQIELALRLDPLNPLIKALYSIDLVFLRKYDQAIKSANEALASDPTNGVAYFALISSLNNSGRHEETLNAVKNLYSVVYNNIKHVFDQDYTKKKYSDALLILADALVSLSDTSYVNPTDIAYLYLFVGKKELAIDWLEKAYEVHDANLPYLLLPIYDGLRNDKRFQDLVRKMKLPDKKI